MSAAGKYAVDTKVSSESSRAEIERVLTRYGAKQFMYGWGEHEGLDMAIVGFLAHDRQVRFNLVMPSRSEPRFQYTPGRKLQRTPAQVEAAYEQEVRQRWRALALTIKALLESVEVGILSFQEAFLARIMLPDGSTVAEAIEPKLQEAYATGGTPSLLPTYRKAIEA